MIRYSLLIQELLKFASVKTDLQAKYPNLSNDIEFLSQADPSGRDKFLNWSMKNLVFGSSKEAIAEAVKQFHLHNQKLENKDINSYTLSSLTEALNQIGNLKSKRKVKNDIKVLGGKQLYEDDQCTVLYVKDKAAACFYGSGTKWCIVMKGANHFEHYDAVNTIFFFVLRKDIVRKKPINPDEIDDDDTPREEDNYKVAIVYMRNPDNEITDMEFFNAKDIKSEDDNYLQTLRSKNTVLAITGEFAKTVPLTEGVIQDRIYKAKVSEVNDPNTAPARLLELASDPNDKVRIALARANLPTEAYSILSKDKNPEVRLEVAKNKYTPTEVSERLAADSDTTVRMEVANNSHVSPTVLDRMSSDSDATVVALVASNMNTTMPTLQKIFNNSSPEDLIIRNALINNRYIPIDMLVSLIRTTPGISLSYNATKRFGEYASQIGKPVAPSDSSQELIDAFSPKR